MGKKISVALFLFFTPLNLLSIHLGVPALEREYQSAIQIWTIAKNKPKYLCSGVAIAPDTVLTSSSCLYNENETLKSNTLFITTSHSMDYEVPLAHALQNVASIARKGIRNREHDLLVIFLNQPLSIEPAIILSEKEALQIRSLTQAFMVGYGNTSPLSADRGTKDWLRDLWSSPKEEHTGERIIARTHLSAVTDFEIDISFEPQDGAPCQGDAGAPLYAHIDTPFSNSQRVIGMVIESPNLASCTKPTRVLRLDAFRDFLNQKMTQGCQEKTRSWCEVSGLFPPGHDEEEIHEKPPEPTENPPFAPLPAPDDKNNEKKTEPENDSPNPDLSTLEPQIPEIQPKRPENRSPKRRLNASAEGVGCSCQQVFTTRK